ncbi:Hsp70 family protein [Pseudoroseicyclus aestuarii]|uniref:Putative chaperone protein n=1 Tax=Pseudoroseicyclus aestuarii TaxID=1795041 RepID=A0A318SX86_9RHOB|nr:Hsp70 family protein [Pseudoroseicyclus aestuarii]PYE84437.1 putative chaperone protein [Pseudoroseicyclus aestuarii]
MTRHFGIDFGTSNSTVGVADAEGAGLIAVEGDHDAIPSAMFIEEDEPQPLFGRAAVQAYVDGEEGRLLRALKSTLGSSLIYETTSIGGRRFAFSDLIEQFFGHLKRQIDLAGGADRVVLGRPVHFVDDDADGDEAAQDVLERIARDAGFSEVSFQYEPIAAALRYEAGIADEELVLIVDIGGGTSDFSIVRVSPQRAKATDRVQDILANDGIRVGGTDFDRLLSLSQAMPHLGMDTAVRGGSGRMPRHYYVDLASWHRINRIYSPATVRDLKALLREADEPALVERMLHVVEERRGHAVAMAVEAAKIGLTDADQAMLRLGEAAEAEDTPVSRAAFETAVEPLAARIEDAIRRVLGQAGLTPGDIGTVFMTGGSSSLPILQRRVAQVLPDAPVTSGDNFGSVGTGLALDARRKFG